VAHALAACLDGAYAVTVTHDGAEALAQAERLPACDLLVTDYLMPNMDGAELAHRLKALHPGARVLMLTGLGEELSLQGDLPDARLMKPFGPAELRDAVALLIGPP
jgi:CheY-like chemotaxis protein